MQLYGIKLLAGRLLSEQRRADGIVSPISCRASSVQSLNVLINAAAARRMGYSPQDAVGKILTMDCQGHAKRHNCGRRRRHQAGWPQESR